MKKHNMKVWFKENEDEIKSKAIKAAWCIGGFALGALVATTITERAASLAIAEWYAKGYIKLFDPAINMEVDIYKWAEIVEKIYK